MMRAEPWLDSGHILLDKRGGKLHYEARRQKAEVRSHKFMGIMPLSY
jgi:hypothetical protein